MKRCNFIILQFIAVLCFAQSNPVVVTINGEDIFRPEFEYAYQNYLSGGNKSLSPDEYIHLFIINKLKIAEAKASGLDTSRVFRSAMEKYRRQLSREYLNQTLTGESTYHQPLLNTAGNTVAEGYHIYKYLPQNMSPFQVNRINHQMDSLYHVLRSNPTIDFNTVVVNFSDDKNFFSVTRLDVPEEFENIVFSLREGEVSQPFFTPQGIHIVKINRRYEKTVSGNGSKVLPGTDKSKRAFINGHPDLDKIKQKNNFVPDNRTIAGLISGQHSGEVLFTIAGRPYTVTEFERFSCDNPRGIKIRLDEFITKSLYDYEASLIEQNPELALRMMDYSDQALLNILNNRETGDNVITDPVSLQAYFEAHKKDYYWELPRYRGIVVHCENKRTGRRIRKQLKKMDESQWIDYLNRTYNSSLQPGVLIEQGTFAVGQNDYVDKLVFKVGRYTPVVSHPFTIVSGRKIKGPETYTEIPDQVAADYRNWLETRWIERLLDKSKVEINQEVLKTVNNQ